MQAIGCKDNRVITSFELKAIPAPLFNFSTTANITLGSGQPFPADDRRGLRLTAFRSLIHPYIIDRVSLMTATIPAPTRTNNKLSGTFYPLQKEELIALRKSRLINNAAYVHLALRMSNPFCDRPIELIPKEFAIAWSIPESSVYEAIGKLKQKKIVDVKTGKVTISWVNLEKSEVSQDSEPMANPVTNSEIPESIMESQNKLPLSRTNLELSENQSPKPLFDNGCNSPQTIQNIQTIQTATEEEKKEILESENSSKITSNSDRKVPAYADRSLDEKTISDEGEEEKEPNQPMSSLSNILNHSTDIKNCQSNSKPVIQKTEQHEQNNEIPADIKEKLQQLNIPLNERVRRAINKYHTSQILGAINHIERTWETINDPLKIFLYQLPKQKVEQLGTRGKVYRAADEGGYCLERIKKMYPHNWREAAGHFGVVVDESSINDE